MAAKKGSGSQRTNPSGAARSRPRKTGAAAEVRAKDPEAPLPPPEGLERNLSPVDLPPPAVALPHGLRWTTTIIAVASLMLALLNAHAIRSWAYQLPTNPASDEIVAAAEGWYAFTDRFGLNAPVETMHGWWQAAEATRFDDDTATNGAGDAQR